jgi:hypothetical protein
MVSVRARTRFLTFAVATALVLVLLALAAQPYDRLKPALDSLMADGELETLRPPTAIIARAWLVIFSGMMILAWVSIVRFPRKWWSLAPQRVRADGQVLWRAVAPRRADRPWLLGLAAVMLVAAAMRLPMIMDGLNHDEAYTVMTFGKSFVYALSNYHVPNNHILHSLLVRLSILAFGYAPWAVRLPALTAGLLTILALYGLGRDAYTRPTGFGAALLIGVVSTHVSYSAKARGYTLLALFAVLLYWLGLLAVRHKSSLAWSGLGLLSGLGMLTMPLMAYPYLALMTWVLAEGLLGGAGPGYRSKGEYLRCWVASGVVALLVTFALYTPALMVTGPDRMAEIGRVAPEIGVSQALEAARANLGQVSGAWLGGLVRCGSLGRLDRPGPERRAGPENDRFRHPDANRQPGCRSRGHHRPTTGL